MATLATVALKCAKQLGRVNSAGTAITDLETEIKEEIGEAIKFYNRQPWALTEVRGMTITTVDGTAWYSALNVSAGSGDQAVSGRTAVDFNQVLNIHYIRQQDEPMDQVSYHRFEVLSEGTPSEGDPSKWTMYAGQIGFWPTPNAAYTIYISGTVKPVVPASDSDTSVWFDEAEEMVVAGAVKRVLLKYIRDEQRAATYVAIERDAMQQLESEHIRKSSSKRLRSHD